ncbi:hypothetical protein M885DRAFT_622981 [Pelagophyceae sp. CCMP2097]|nr:hypothetical protein M885DRAFT_622981 [Pelagophyceae sp. CCMP2097]
MRLWGIVASAVALGGVSQGAGYGGMYTLFSRRPREEPSGAAMPRPRDWRTSTGAEEVARKYLVGGWAAPRNSDALPSFLRHIRRDVLALPRSTLQRFDDAAGANFTGDAEFARAAQALARPRGAAQIDVVSFGGSVTVGHGTGRRASQFLPYIQLLAAALRAIGHERMRTFNFGVPAAGSAIPSVCFASQLLRAGADPKLIILEFSINGQERLSDLVDGLRDLYPAALILYVDTFSQHEPPEAWAAASAQLGDFMRLRQVPLVTLRVFSNATKVDGLNLFDKDLHHLNVRGHALVTYAVLGLIQRLAGQPGARTAAAPRPAAPRASAKRLCLTTDAALSPALLAPRGGSWRLERVHDDAKKIVWAVGENHSRAAGRATFDFTLDAESSDVFVVTMRSGGVPRYGVADVMLDGAHAARIDGGDLGAPYHILKVEAVATSVSRGRHALTMAVSNDTTTGGHAFAVYGILADPSGRTTRRNRDEARTQI